MTRQLECLWEDEEAPTAAEYSVLAGLIILVCVAVITSLGVGVNGLFARVLPAFP